MKNGLKEWKFHPMAMHLHCGHQPKASMESHIFNAASMGMEYIRFTPHDTRTGPDKYAVRTFDFSRKEAVYADESGYLRGWEIGGDAEVHFDGFGMCLEAKGSSTEGNAKFYSQGKRQAVSLLAGVKMTLEMDVETDGTGEVILDVEMSQRIPDYQPAHLFYRVQKEIQKAEEATEPFGGVLPPHTAVLPLRENMSGVYRLRISEDAEKIGDPVGGLDNAFVFLHVRVLAGDGGRAYCKLRTLEIQVEREFEEVIAEQRKLGDQIGADYGVKPFITAEISGAGPHKNYYSQKVPVIHYREKGYDITQAEAIAHVQEHGGIFCCNHPLDNGKYGRSDYSREELDRLVVEEAVSLAAAKVYGATLMEVGFPEGRGPFAWKDYLRLWDLLSLAGVFITGDGDSDSHDSLEDWFENNNFVTWIGADASLTFPIEDEVFIESLKAGRAYCGDPVQIKGKVWFASEEGAPMGAILTVADRDQEPRRMRFKAEALKKGWRICVVVNGETTDTYEMEEDCDFVCDFSVKPNRPVSFARVEIYNEEGRGILLTNPIYLVRTAEFAGELPACRIYEQEISQSEIQIQK